ncbi:hypothetical protein Plhal304r1_c004g0015281 [Plasmopara halstedii]
MVNTQISCRLHLGYRFFASSDYDAKLIIFRATANPAVDLRRLPPSQKECPPIFSTNSYEWLSEGQSARQNVILLDKSIDPPQSVPPFVALTEVSEAVLNGTVYRSNVEQLSLKELCKLRGKTSPPPHQGFGHGVLRELSTHTYPSTDDDKMFDRVCTLYLNQSDYDF